MKLLVDGITFKQLAALAFGITAGDMWSLTCSAEFEPAGVSKAHLSCRGSVSCLKWTQVIIIITTTDCEQRHVSRSAVTAAHARTKTGVMSPHCGTRTLCVHMQVCDCRFRAVLSLLWVQLAHLTKDERIWCSFLHQCSLSLSDLHSIESREGNLPFQRHSCLVHLKPLQPSEEDSY